MEFKFAHFLNTSSRYVPSVHLNEFQVPSSSPMPGIFGAARSPNGVIVPYNLTPKYEVSKVISSVPAVLSGIQDTIEVPKTAPIETSQFPLQIAEAKTLAAHQIGFGNKKEIDEEGDIDLESSKPVSEGILAAFGHPTIDVETVVFKPKEKN